MKKLMIAAALFFSVIVANAQWERRRHPKPNQYPDNQRYENRNNYRNSGRLDDFQREARRRVADGIANGSISSREARQLLGQLEDIERKEQRYWRDGVLDPRERQELSQDLAYLERRIWREKRDFDPYTYEDYRNNRNCQQDRYGN